MKHRNFIGAATALLFATSASAATRPVVKYEPGRDEPALALAVGIASLFEDPNVESDGDDTYMFMNITLEQLLENVPRNSSSPAEVRPGPKAQELVRLHAAAILQQSYSLIEGLAAKKTQELAESSEIFTPANSQRQNREYLEWAACLINSDDRLNAYGFFVKTAATALTKVDVKTGQANHLEAIVIGAYALAVMQKGWWVNRIMHGYRPEKNDCKYPDGYKPAPS